MAKTTAAGATTSPPAFELAPTRFEVLPVDQIAESPTNHRRTWGDMEGLVASVREKGVIEPILVRPMKGTGPGQYMVVFGARRLRATQTAGLTHIPAMVRELGDLEVVELQVVENLQRADVHPLEEAEGYELLLQSKERTYTVEEIAAKVGKSKAYVYGRMKLLALSKEAREAFYEGKLSASVALLIARIPVLELQEKALEEVLEGEEYDGGPMSYRDAQEHIVAKYTLRLADAPFDRGDPDLVAGAGVCTTCPKRSGAQPELFADVKSPDLCTDPTCFAAKKEAAWRRKADAAKGGGAKVLTAAETKKIFDRWSPGHVRYDAPYVKLTDKVPDDPKNRTWKQVLGKEAPEKVVARDPRGAAVELVERAAAIEAAKKAGVAVAKPREAPTYDRAKYEREEKIRREVQRRVAAAVVARFEKAEPDAKLWRLIVETLVDNYDAAPAAERRFGDGPEQKVIGAAVAKMKESELRGFALELALVPAIFTRYDRDNAGKGLLAWAKVDLKAFEKEARSAIKEQEAADAAKPEEKTAAPAPAKKKGGRR